ncbi:MAG: Stage V sporulation protein AD [Firmicutes bacterium ADurb.Bin182]|nr:MAG: Stage V sporulation protein AD [Firmicutes bacterium ADurb.Bin182]
MQVISKKKGRQSVVFTEPPMVFSSASIVGDVEAKGPLGSRFDLILDDDTWGEKSWEKAESKMFERSVRLAAEKSKIDLNEIDCLLGGDLLNQIISASYAARTLKIPYFGLYGACSTMTESLLISGMLIDGGFREMAACTASSHFSTAERQYRFPLELGNQIPPTSQRTVTGAGCVIIGNANKCKDGFLFKSIRITAGTIGRIVDLGITDASNMGAAMAPAAADTISAHLQDMNRTVDDYDLIVTGDLGKFGSEMLFDLCKEKNVDISGKHADCGCLIYTADQDVNCGGSGCGCSAVTLASYYLERIENANYDRILFLATGALMSPSSSLQGESIPGIAHAVVMERSCCI